MGKAYYAFWGIVILMACIPIVIIGLPLSWLFEKRKSNDRP